MTAVGTVLALSACGSAAAHPRVAEQRPSPPGETAVSNGPDAILALDAFGKRTCKAGSGRERPRILAAR